MLKNTIGLLIILSVFGFVERIVIFAEDNEKQEVSLTIDNSLSTHKSTIDLYIKALQMNDRGLFEKTLAPNAYTGDIDPHNQKLMKSPDLIGYEIYKKQQLNRKVEIVPSSNIFTKKTDLEIYVIYKFKKNDTVIKDYGILILREINDKWKIITSVPFWPEKIRELYNDSDRDRGTLGS